MLIRSEGHADASLIRNVVSTAFAAVPYSNGAEAAIIDALRAEGALTLSLVAEDHDRVVGYAAFSPVTIDRQHRRCFGLGPVAVLPDVQGCGVGSALIRTGLKQLADDGAACCVVLGDPNYYGRFGFVADPMLHYPGPPMELFQRLVMAGPPPSGEVAYHPAFDAT